MSGKLIPGTFDVVPRAMVTDPKMTAAAKCVVQYLARYGEKAFPSYATIARDLGIHRVTVITAVQKAMACGYLNRSARKDACGDPTSNFYSINFPGGGGSAGTTTQSSQDNHGGSPSATRVVAPALPYREPPIETYPTRRSEHGTAGVAHTQAGRAVLMQTITDPEHAHSLTPDGARARTRPEGSMSPSMTMSAADGVAHPLADARPEKNARQDEEDESGDFFSKWDNPAFPAAALAEEEALYRRELGALGVAKSDVALIEAEAAVLAKAEPEMARGARAAALSQAVEMIKAGAAVSAVLAEQRKSRAWYASVDEEAAARHERASRTRPPKKRKQQPARGRKP